VSRCSKITLVVQKQTIDVKENITRLAVSEKTNTINLKEEKVTKVELAGQKTLLTVSLVGVQGPKGDPGAPGLSAQSYVHDQLVASDTWVINHNLGFKPICQVFSAGSREILVDVLHTSTNQTIVYLTSPNTGFARLI